MRPIDADILLKKIADLYTEGEEATEADKVVNDVIDLIDNAPEFELPAWQITYLKRIFEKAIPRGEWIKHISSIECSCCGEKLFCSDEDENCQDYDPCADFSFKYCPNCGADMRGGRE